MRAGARLALGLSTGDDWTYFESVPLYVRPGENPSLVFDLRAASFKSEASGWQYETKIEDLDEVRAVYVLVHPLTSGTVVLREMSVVR